MLERAALALRMQQFGQAEQLAAEALRASRGDAAAASILARALMAQNRAADAIAPLERVARRNGDPMIEVLLGAALGGAGRVTDAIEQLRRTAARRPPFVPAFQELAGQLAKAGRVDEAVAAVEDGLKLVPGNLDLKIDLGRLELLRNKRGAARAVLTSVLDVAPGRYDALKELSRATLLDGDYAAAADLYRRALALHPEDALARADLAACLLEMGEREAGEAALRLAYRGQPHMLGRATHALVHASHGRFFFSQAAVADFLKGSSK